MRNIAPHERLRPVVVVLAMGLAACQQSNQELPFQIVADEGASSSIGPSGGLLSLPPSFAIDFPDGAFASTVSVRVTPRVDAPFPSDAGVAVPGTAFDVEPPGQALNAPALVQIAVDPRLLEAGEDVRLSVAVQRVDGSVSTYQGYYDVTNGLLSAPVDVLGPMAAVVTEDAIAVNTSAPPALDGGAIAPPTAPSPTASGTSGPAATSHGGVQFTASCAPEARRCFSSGLVRLWADDVVRQRLGEDLFLLAPRVEASLDFLRFDAQGLPTEIVGSVRVGGELRAKLNSTVSRYALDDGVTTGASNQASVTPLAVSGNVMIVSQTTALDGSIEFDEEVLFDVSGIGTSEMLIIEVEAEVEFDNQDGSVSTGVLTAHLRLRR